uniref:TFIIS N-terminal domain-containing protein n=2 Tax=Oryza meridionalis TaxID=40149 RepID=A0A0E0DNM0_9ORYZ
MDYWLGFFRGVGDSIFDAIAVAASDHPAALRSRRDAIAQRLYTAYHRRCLPREAPPPRRRRRSCSTLRAPPASDRADVIADDSGVPCCEDPVAAETERIKAVLLNDQEKSEAMLLELLRRLQQLELTVDTLTVTEIGKAVSSFRKHNSNFLPVKPHTKEIINNINFMPWSDVCFVTGGSDHAVNKKMIHGTTRKCTRICILLLSWVLLDYSKKKMQFYQLAVTRGLYHLIWQLEGQGPRLYYLHILNKQFSDLVLRLPISCEFALRVIVLVFIKIMQNNPLSCF